MSALDEEDYGDIADEDLIEAFSQASQDLPPHSRPPNRRKISDVSTDGSIGTQRKSRDLMESGVSADEEEENGTSKKKKYKIHTGVADVPPRQILGATQVDGLPDSSPYRIRGPIYRRPRTDPQKPSIFSATPPRAAPLRKPLLSISPRASHSQDDMARGLEDAPSDDVSTPSPPPKSLHSSFTRQGVGASQAGLRQTTLFGHTVQEEVAASQVHKRHSFIVDKPPELPTHHLLDHEALKTWIYPTNLGTIRDYQFSIVRNGLFNNLLVALPTGLGKTFIAATIMLNYFRWTKDAQIIFVAPTKPLVAQQVDACFKIVGIPRSATTMLTGGQPPVLRAEEWLDKRVFFMTPQTLIHDLSNGIADPKKIVLLVVDEAHRATGNYAYVKVVQFLRRFNQSFRILALTATPGGSVEAVQEVIDGLGISKVEIRTEESIDIQQFVHRRDIDQILFDPSDEIIMVKELFSKALQPLVNQLCGQNAYWNKDPMSLTSFGLIQARKRWFMSDAGRKASMGLKGMMNGLFSILASVAHGIKLLNYHGIGPFFAAVKEFRQAVEDGNKGGNYRRQIVESPDFKKMMDRIQLWITKDDFVGHPKLTHLCNTILNHFLDAGENRLHEGVPPSSTRVIVFAEYRDSAEDIARILNKHGPMIRASVFVGQADSKRSEGMNQAKQLETIRKFQAGLFNVIVATSIGEEGLDIGQVDLIVCYDASGSPIRMLQRMGRTGRKRAGNIVLLLMRGKEEESFTKAKDNYEQMQKMISSGDRFSFRHDLSTRIVPRDVKPVVDKRMIDIPTENAQDGTLPEPRRRRAVAKKKPAKKFHMPDGVETGFQKASRLSDGAALTDFGVTINDEPDRQLQLAPIPSVDSVLLSFEDAKELERRYQHVPGSEFQEVSMPDITAQTAAQRSLLPTANIPHGWYTKKCVLLFKTLAGCQRPEDRYVKPYGDEELDEISWTAPPLVEDESHVFVDLIRRKKAGPAKRKQPEYHSLIVTDDESGAERDTHLPTRLQNGRKRALSISEDESASQSIIPAKRQQTRKRTAFRSSEAEGDDLANSETPSEDSNGSGSESLKYFVAEDDEEPAMATNPSTLSSAPSAVPPIPKLFYEPTQFTATQDTNDEDDMPDIGEIVGKRTKPTPLSPLEERNTDDEGPVGGYRGKRRRFVEDDTDE